MINPLTVPRFYAMMTPMIRYVSLLALAASLCFCSCSGQADAVIRRNGAADLTLDSSLSPRTAALIRSFAALAGDGEGPVIDGPAIAKSVSGAPGVSGAVFLNRDAASVNGTITLTRIDEFLRLSGAGADGSAPFIVWDGAGLLVFSLDRETSPTLLALFSEEVIEYLSALMAPCATGDPISKQEYLALVRSIYGRPVADEISVAQIGIALELPGAVTSIQGGTFRGRRAEFHIPLLDLLVLETPLACEVRWGR
jgi:hypothetical protein